MIHPSDKLLDLEVGQWLDTPESDRYLETARFYIQRKTGRRFKSELLGWHGRKRGPDSAQHVGERTRRFTRLS